MIILKTLGALRGGYVTTAQMDEIFKRSSDNKQFDERLSTFIKDEAKFQDEWVELGVAKRKEDIWYDIINGYYTSPVESVIQSTLKLRHSDIMLNFTALNEIYKDVASSFDVAPLGSSLTDIIRKMARERLLYSEVKYKRKFEIYEDQDYAALVRTSTNSLTRKRNVDEIMENFDGDDFFATLMDLYEMSSSYVYTPQGANSKAVRYSMYFSFLRTYFKMSLDEINAGLKGIVELNIRQHDENKFRKLDNVMETLLEDYIIPGIYEGNLAELQLALIDVVGHITITNTAAVFKLERVDLGSVGGNFNSPYQFVSNTAVNHYDSVVKGLIALSRLYHKLKECGVSPYEIQPQIFFQNYGNPAKKYKNLKELVNYNKQYVEVFNKYDMKKDLISLHNICNSGGKSHYVVHDPKAYGAAVRYDLFVLLTQAARAVYKNHEATTVDLRMGGVSINIFNLAKAIRNNINPLYLIMQNDRLDFDIYEELLDPDAYIDEEYAREYLSKLLGRSLGNLANFEVDVYEVMEVLKDVNSEVGDVLYDMAKVNLEEEINLIIATMDLAYDILDLENRVLESTIYTKHKPAVEYASIILTSDIFKDVKHLITHEDAFTSRHAYNESIVVLANKLLNKYMEVEVSEERTRQFLFTEDHCPAYSSFITYSIQVLFRTLSQNLGSMNAHYLNLNDSGKPIKLNAEKLDEILLPGDNYMVDEKNFQIFISQARKDSLNYLVDSLGRPFSVITKDKKTGILHASGLYIFSDGSVIPWRSSYDSSSRN